jgi:branched-chain amino acid transport system permease protein
VNEFVSLIVAGIVTGSIYAISASGLVVTYKTTGFFNFAHGAMGMVLAYLFWQLWQGWHLPALVSLAVVLMVAAPLFGSLVEWLVARPLHGASTNIRLAVMLGLLLLLLGVAGTVWNQSSVYNVPEFFAGRQVAIGGVNLSYEQLITVGIAIVVAVAMRSLFYRTRTGVAMRAVVDDPGLVSLAGASSRRIASYAWMIGVMFAGLAGILLAPTTMSMVQLTELVIYGYAAAVVGRLSSLPLTFLGAMVLGVAESLAIGYVPSNAVTDVTSALPMALLFLVLLVVPEGHLPVGRVFVARLPQGGLSATVGGAAAVIVTVILLGTFLTGSNLFTLGNALVLSILALSLVLLSGYGGQISLCQYTFLGIGALTMHWVGGGGSVLGVVAASGLCAVAGAALALPALSISGLYLGLATLAFAVLMDNVFFTSDSVMGSGGTVSVGRPDLFGFRFDGDRSFDLLLAAVLALCIIGVGAIRRQAFGRRLLAMNDSPTACVALGVNLTVTKLVVFSLSAGLAGLAGALYGGLSTTIGAAQFQFLDSITIFVAVTLAGANSLTGAVMAGTFVAIGPVIGQRIPQVPDLTALLVGTGIVIVGRNPLGVDKIYADVSRLWQRRTGAGPRHGCRFGTPQRKESTAPMAPRLGDPMDLPGEPGPGRPN